MNYQYNYRSQYIIIMWTTFIRVEMIWSFYIHFLYGEGQYSL